MLVALGSFFAGEQSEVVALRTIDDEGHAHDTKLWIVDHDGRPWVRGIRPTLRWLERIRANPRVELVRGGKTTAHTATIVETEERESERSTPRWPPSTAGSTVGTRSSCDTTRFRSGSIRSQSLPEAERVLTHRGGCHCGAVAFEVDAPAQLEVVECNCSICGPAAYRHLIAPRERFRLLRGEDALASYRFGTNTARHLFCRICGVKSFYVPRSHPDGVSVNARCLAPGTVESIRVRPFDGANWEEHRHELDPSPRAQPEPRASSTPDELVREIGLPQRSRAGSLEAVLEVADALPRGRALDVPCGPGLASEALRRLGFQVTAADLDEKGFAAGPEIRFERLDLDRPLPFADASFELVHCGDGIEHLENPMAALRELARVLAPGGTLLLTTPNYSSLERRLRFLLSGSLAKPLPRAGPGARKTSGATAT